MKDRTAAFALVGVMLIAVACGDDDSTSTGTTGTTVTSGSSVPVDTSTAVWPTSDSTTRYDDPVEVATAFATDYIGFVDPVVGAFQQGDSRSGEVEVKPASDGPVTTILVRQLGTGDSWWVLGAATAGIQLSEPAALATISSPVQLAGTSTAFEATVQSEVRQDGDDAALGEGFVMGGSMGEMGPFDAMLAFTQPTAAYGAVMLSTLSMENGQVWEATVIRVQFASA